MVLNSRPLKVWRVRALLDDHWIHLDLGCCLAVSCGNLIIYGRPDMCPNSLLRDAP